MTLKILKWVCVLCARGGQSSLCCLPWACASSVFEAGFLTELVTHQFD